MKRYLLEGWVVAQNVSQDMPPLNEDMELQAWTTQLEPR